MSITVKVIFLGLIGFVPGPEGREEVTALLVDPIRAQPCGTSCPAPDHYSAVFLLHGTCTGDCYRAGDEREFGSDREGGLEWHLREEALDISGDDDDELEFLNPNFFQGIIRGASPRGPRQTSYFSWVPDINQLTNNHGQLRRDCLRPDPGCPLHALFRFQGGEAATCHLFHDAEGSEDDVERSEDKRRNVRIFNYVTTDGRRFRRAVADAVQIIFQEKGDRVRLWSERLPGLRPPRSAEAWLSPDRRGRLTLIVANLPPRHKSAHSPDIYSRPHSDVFFHLLEERDGPRSSRILSDKKRSVDPGSCEEEISELDGFPINDRRELPHAATACDGTRFPKPN